MDSYLHWRRITTNKAMVLAMLIEHLFSFLLNRKEPKTKDTLSRVCQCIAMFRRCSSCVWCRWWSSDMLYCFNPVMLTMSPFPCRYFASWFSSIFILGEKKKCHPIVVAEKLITTAFSPKGHVIFISLPCPDCVNIYCAIDDDLLTILYKYCCNTLGLCCPSVS